MEPAQTHWLAAKLGIVAQGVLSVQRSAAQSARVSAQFDAGEFTLRVRDDGQGFRPPPRLSDLSAHNHYGLMGMQERAELIGARLTIRARQRRDDRIAIASVEDNPAGRVCGGSPL